MLHGRRCVLLQREEVQVQVRRVLVPVSSPYTRVCTACGHEKPLGQYAGAAKVCKPCTSAQARRKRADPVSRRADRDRRLRARYGITLAEYERMARAQRWRCKICERRAYPAGSLLAVDHNHATGEVRGLLCSPCNSALGLMGEKADRLMAAAQYLAESGHYAELHR